MFYCFVYLVEVWGKSNCYYLPKMHPLQTEAIKCYFSSLDVTAVCLLEGFQNQQCMILADRILKAIGKELAEKHFKVGILV